MRLDIRKLAAADKTSLHPMEYECDLDLSRLTRWGQNLFPGPVSVKGVLYRDEAGVIRTDCSVQAVLSVPCARCLKQVDTPISRRFSHIIVPGEDTDDNGEWIFAPGNMLDIDDMVAADLLLELEDVVLCSPNCKGLCPICGSDRNTQPCSCDTSIPDPRFDALRKLIDQPET